MSKKKYAKVAYNACFGGFRLSNEAMLRLAELKGLSVYPEDYYCITLFYLEPKDKANPDKERPFLDETKLPRHDPELVQVVQEMGKKASGQCANIKLEKVPSGTLYRIDEYDGNESVCTRDDYEWIVAP